MVTSVLSEYLVAGQNIGCKGTTAHERVCLTDLYKAAGSPSNRTPGQWRQLPETARFIAAQAKQLHVEEAALFESRRGRTGGTWAHWAIAISYVTYLNKNVPTVVSRAWPQLQQKERDRNLTVSRKFHNTKTHYLAQGYNEREAEELAEARTVSKPERNRLTAEWAFRGAHQCDFGKLTNAGYVGLYGKTAAQMCEQQQLPPKTNMRDYLSLRDILQTSLHEVLTRERLQKGDVRGTAAMEQVSREVGAQLREAIGRILTSPVMDVVEVKGG